MRNPAAILIVSLAALALAALHGSAHAGGLEVSPTRFHLSAKVKTGVLTLSNDGSEEIRIQATAYHWTQSARGEIVLAATTDVIVYPSLFTLPAGKHRSVRIGAAVGAAGGEGAYRVIIEELPPLHRAADASPKIRVLTRLSIPVFVRPAKLVTRGEIRGLALHGGNVAFQVANTGTTYFVLGHARVVGRDSTGIVLFDRSVTGWYVLAGDSWNAEVDVDADVCARITHLAVEVTAAKKTWQDAIDVSEADCAR